MGINFYLWVALVVVCVQVTLVDAFVVPSTPLVPVSIAQRSMKSQDVRHASYGQNEELFKVDSSKVAVPITEPCEVSVVYPTWTPAPFRRQTAGSKEPSACACESDEVVDKDDVFVSRLQLRPLDGDGRVQGPGHCLCDGDRVDPRLLETRFTIIAVVRGKPQAVRFKVNKRVVMEEQVAPYGIAGDENGKFSPFIPPVAHNLTVVEAEVRDADGWYRGMKRALVYFNKIEVPSQTQAAVHHSAAPKRIEPTRTPRPTVMASHSPGVAQGELVSYSTAPSAFDTADCACENNSALDKDGIYVSRLQLRSLDADGRLQDGGRCLCEGDRIDRRSFKHGLTVLAIVRGEPEAVRFLIDGETVNEERLAPYAIAGDKSGRFMPYTPQFTSTFIKVAAQARSAGGTYRGTISVSICFGSLADPCSKHDTSRGSPAFRQLKQIRTPHSTLRSSHSIDSVASNEHGSRTRSSIDLVSLLRRFVVLPVKSLFSKVAQQHL